MCPAVELELDVDYSFYGKLTYLLPSYGAVIQDTQFGEGVQMRLLLRRERRRGWKRNCGNFPPEQWLLWCSNSCGAILIPNNPRIVTSLEEVCEKSSQFHGTLTTARSGIACG